MVYLGAYDPMRPEELAGLRRRDVALDNLVIRVRVAEPERPNGKRAPGESKSDVGVRADFLHKEVKQHLAWFAEKESDGLLFVGENGAHVLRSKVEPRPHRRRSPGRLPVLRPSPHGAHALDPFGRHDGPRRVVVEKTALIYQHPDEERQRDLAAGLDELGPLRACEAHKGKDHDPTHHSSFPTKVQYYAPS